jgi:nicotinamidase-related amidase
MTNGRGDLHGSAPDNCAVALLLIDMINDLAFPEGPRLLRRALPMAERLAALAARARRAGVPVIWVNDNFGRWRSDFRTLIAHCVRPGAISRPLIERLAPPASEDYFVVKPKHSGFFDTTLALLLRHLGTRRLVLTGMATEICVLFTANDAYMRDFEIVVPRDGVASSNTAGHNQALALMQSALKAKLVTTDTVDFIALGGRRPHAGHGARAAADKRRGVLRRPRSGIRQAS